MKKTILLALIIGFFSCAATAQTRYIVQFKNKQGTPFTTANPSPYLTARSIARRARYSIAIDSTDLPITPRYIDSVRLAGAVTLINVSKWLNQVCFQTSDAAAITKINSFSFVQGPVTPIAARQQASGSVNKQLDPQNVTDVAGTTGPQSVSDYYNYGQSYGQVHLLSGEFLHNHGFHGEGMQMAVMDAGFFHYLTLPTFDSIRNNGQILGTWDFVANHASVDEDDAHGMQCLSTIGSNMPGNFVGQAPKTSFYLYRTEEAATEYPVEEQNWAAAAERADSLGVDIFSTSLGYTQFDNPVYNHTYADMNGNVTIAAKACDLAAKKGIISVVAAGNEGTSGWHYISTPSDADSALCVGAVTTNRVVGSFSSYGPSSDGQIKPDVAAVGVAAVIASSGTGQPTMGNGTSFACPNMAGITTCLWQAFPEVSNMTIIQTLRLSGDKVTAPDDRTGYGVPDVKKAYVLLLKLLHSQQSSLNNCQATYQWTVKGDTSARFVLERKLVSDANYVAINTQQGSGAYGAKTFSYTDNLSALPVQTVKYRIRMSISADTTFYLDSTTVNYTTSCATAPTTEKITVGPNPTNDKLFVTVVRNNAVRIMIVLHTVSGQKIYTINNNQAAGSQLYSIPMKEMSAGVYYVTVYTDDNKVLSKKIVKL